MKHNTGGILQSSKVEDTLLVINSASQGGVSMAEQKPKSHWVVDSPRYGSSWEDMEDGLTTSRRSVFARPPEPADPFERRPPSLSRQDERAWTASDSLPV